MVFVSMESDELLTRTAQYQIQYLPGRPQRRGTVIFRHEEDDGSITRVHSRPLRAYSYGADDDDDDEEDEDNDSYQTTAQIPPEFTAPPPPFNITTECSDEDSDADQVPARRPRRRRTPNRIGALPFESDSSDESINTWAFRRSDRYRDWPNDDHDIIHTQQPAPATGRYRAWPNDYEDMPTQPLFPPIVRTIPSSSSRLATARGGSRLGSSVASTATTTTTTANNNRTADITLEEAQEASQIATQEAVRAVGGGELMTPLVHFFIKHDKSKCTVRFDPPVSGRFILLKMWSPHHLDEGPGKNIDIQAVIARGFAGPRFTPAVEMA